MRVQNTTDNVYQREQTTQSPLLFYVFTVLQRKEGKLPGPPPGALCAAAPQMPRRRLLKQMSPLLPQIPVPSTDALLLTRRTPTHPVRPDFCMSTGAGPPQNPGTEGAPLGCGFGPLQLFSRDTPRCPPGSSRAALVSSGMRSRARTLLAVCPPCVCVCFSNVLAVPDFANAAHTRGVAAQSSAFEHRQGSGVPTGFRARCSAFTGVSTTQEGPRSAFFTCPARQLMSQLPDHTEWQVLKTRGIRETEPLQAGICPPLKKRICVERVRSSGPWE